MKANKRAGKVTGKELWMFCKILSKLNCTTINQFFSQCKNTNNVNKNKGKKILKLCDETDIIYRCFGTTGQMTFS